MHSIVTLKNQALREVYDFIDKNIRPLPKKENGEFDEFAEGFHNNDVDALRHAYVSGVYAMEYNESVANVLGRLNELVNTSSGPNGDREENMDLWNNAVGRSYGVKSTSRSSLLKSLKVALDKGELITDPSDERNYGGEGVIKRRPKSLVIVLEESSTGENLSFLDVGTKKFMTKKQFVSEIKNGIYPGYTVKRINGVETPVSKRDRLNFNNLG